MRTLKILGFLLTYPSEAMQKALPECVDILKKENILTAKTLTELEVMMQHMVNAQLVDMQECYVDLFDRTPSLCLHLFEHIHGDSRDRGGALADLAEIYRAHNLEISEDEFPDYLPLFLEYLSLLSLHEAQQNLKNIVNILALLKKRLENRSSYYSQVFAALLMFCEHIPDKAMLEEALKLDDGSMNTRDMIDEQWQEQFAFGTSKDQCHPRCGSFDSVEINGKYQDQSGEKNELL